LTEKYLIGDTIRFTASILKLGSEEPDVPEVVTVTIYQKDGTKLLDKANASITDIPGNYIFDWKITGTEGTPLIKDCDLVAVWDWSSSQKKRLEFLVIPEV
jgi:hypothetical protein